MHPTKQRLLDSGLAMLLERGYNDLGIQALLDSTQLPRGSFYHHFGSKEELALQAIDLYLMLGHQLLEATLTPDGRPPRQRIRSFFERLRDLYASQGYLGCLLGGLGQELSGSNDAFRRKIDECIGSIAGRIAACLEEARRDGSLPASVDPRQFANILVNAWEGAALRSRLLRSAAPLDAFIEFYLPESSS